MSIRQRKHMHTNTLQRCQTKILLPLIVCHEVLKNHRKTEKGNELFLIHQYLFLDDQSLPPNNMCPATYSRAKIRMRMGDNLRIFK